MKPRGAYSNISLVDPASSGVWLRDSCASGSVCRFNNAG